MQADPAQANRRMADDFLAQLFSGADHPEMPADALVEIRHRWAPQRPSVITPEFLIICNAAGAKFDGVG